jgi:hypothetical protein
MSPGVVYTPSADTLSAVRPSPYEAHQTHRPVGPAGGKRAGPTAHPGGAVDVTFEQDGEGDKVTRVYGPGVPIGRDPISPTRGR